MGNGGFTIEYPPLHELASSRNKYIRALDNFLTYLDPEPHRKTFMKPFMRLDSSEYCSTCHKVHLDQPVNSYRWIRGFNDYDNWQASGVSGQGARSFYYPPSPPPARTATCRSCARRPGQPQRQGALAPIRRRQHRSRLRQRRPKTTRGDQGLPHQRLHLRRHLRRLARHEIKGEPRCAAAPTPAARS
jgi:hypothetical protein